MYLLFEVIIALQHVLLNNEMLDLTHLKKNRSQLADISCFSTYSALKFEYFVRNVYMAFISTNKVLETSHLL